MNVIGYYKEQDMEYFKISLQGLEFYVKKYVNNYEAYERISTYMYNKADPKTQDKISRFEKTINIQKVFLKLEEEIKLDYLFAKSMSTEIGSIREKRQRIYQGKM